MGLYENYKRTQETKPMGRHAFDLAMDGLIHSARTHMAVDWPERMQSLLNPALLGKEDEPEEPVTFAPTDLVFPNNEPNVFWDHEDGIPYRGQDIHKRRIEILIKALGDDERYKSLLVGPAGTGKTALAWIIARYLIKKRGGRFFEVLPQQISDKTLMDRFMSQLEPKDIVFFDEVHELQQEIGGGEPLFHTLADTGVARYPMSDGSWIEIHPSISFIGATTDPGKLHDALLRRFGSEIRLDPPDIATITDILHDRGFPIHAEAALEIAERSGRLPWQALAVYGEAKAVAMVAGHSAISWEDADQALAQMTVDERGLTEEDRTVLKTLLSAPTRIRGGEIKYRMSEPALCSAAGVDKGTYKRRIQPKLMLLGYLNTSWGQVLNDKAIRDYGYLIQNT